MNQSKTTADDPRVHRHVVAAASWTLTCAQPSFMHPQLSTRVSIEPVSGQIAQLPQTLDSVVRPTIIPEVTRVIGDLPAQVISLRQSRATN